MNFKHLIIVFFASILIAGCSEHQKVLKSDDLKLKYDKAIEYYEGGDFVKALPLFEELIIVYRGTPRAELLSYYQAYCDYELGDLLLASFRFRTFAKTFPVSQYAEECLFMSAYCNYLNSPKSSLDQSATYSAINDLKLFTKVHSESKLVDSCNTLIDDLRAKLEQKSYDNAYQYYHMRRHKAAIVGFENLLQDYPFSPHEEEARFIILESNYNLASNSIYSKKGERLLEVQKAYDILKMRYPESKHIKKADQVLEKTQKEIIDFPKELYDDGYFEESAKWSRYLLENESLTEHQKSENTWRLVDSYYRAATTGMIEKKKNRLASAWLAYEKYSVNLEGSKYNEKAELVYNITKQESEKIHLTLPMHYYSTGSYLKAINAFEKTLEGYPTFERREEFKYNLLHSHLLRAENTNKFIDSKTRFNTAEKYYSDNTFGEFQKLADEDMIRIKNGYDAAVTKELKRLFKIVKQENTNFASEFEYAVAFYQTEKDEMKTEKGKSKAQKIYDSILKYGDKYQLSKTE